MRKSIISIFTFIVLSLSIQIALSQPGDGKFFRISFYNVENLFDTIDDPKTDDQDFLPGSRIPWTAERYETKLDHLAEVIADLSEGQPVAVFRAVRD